MHALLLIECQNEWLAPNGKLHGLLQDHDQLTTSLTNIKKALAHARSVGMPIAHSGLRFQPGWPELANGRGGLHQAIPQYGTFPVGSEAAAYYAPFLPQTGEFEVMGRTGSSAFAGSNLDVWLRNNGITDLYLVGYALHVCVESTLREAHDKGYNPILLSDATSAFTAAQRDHVLEHVVHHYGHHQNTADFVARTAPISAH